MPSFMGVTRLQYPALPPKGIPSQRPNPGQLSLHSRYPQLPYEKFFLDGKVVEVLVVSLNSPRIFRKISEARMAGWDWLL